MRVYLSRKKQQQADLFKVEEQQVFECVHVRYSLANNCKLLPETIHFFTILSGI